MRCRPRSRPWSSPAAPAGAIAHRAGPPGRNPRRARRPGRRHHRRRRPVRRRLPHRALPRPRPRALASKVGALAAAEVISHFGARPDGRPSRAGAACEQHQAPRRLLRVGDRQRPGLRRHCATATAEAMVARGVDLVYGGGRLGLMGTDRRRGAGRRRQGLWRDPRTRWSTSRSRTPASPSSTPSPPCTSARRR